MTDYRALHAYSNDDAARYDERRFTSSRGRAVDLLEWRLLQRGLRRLEALAGPVRSVLDVPCGTGRMARRLSMSGRRVTLVDASEDMLAIAQRRCPEAVCLPARVESLPLGSLSIDAIVSVRLMGHMPPEARLAAFRELGRVARLGAVVFYPGDSAWLRFRRRWQAAHGRVLAPWYPLSRNCARESARVGGFRIIGAMQLLGPFTETRAMVLMKTEQVR